MPDKHMLDKHMLDKHLLLSPRAKTAMCRIAVFLFAVGSGLATATSFSQQTTPLGAGPAAGTSEAAKQAASEPAGKQRRAAEKYYAEGVQATEKGDVDRAHKAFANATKADPSNHEYEIDAQIAQQHYVTKLIRDAEKARIAGQMDVARARLAEAASLDPQNPVVAQHVDELARLAPSQPQQRSFDASIAPAIELTPNPSRQSFHLKATKQEVLRRVLLAYGVSMTADSSLGPDTVRFDVDDVDFAQAARLVSLATNSFFVPLDPVRVLVAKNSRENHQTYDRMSLETIRLPGLDAAEYTDVSNLAKNVLGVQQASIDPDRGTLTVRAPTETLTALNQTLTDLLDGKSEVMLDVKVYEVADTRTRLYGIQPLQNTSVFNIPSELNGVISSNSSLVQQIISSGLASAGDFSAIAAILIASGEVSSSLLSQPFATFGKGLTYSGLTLSGATANLSLNTSKSRSLDELQIRLNDNGEGTIRSGTRYPITTSSYSGIAASSVSIPGITSAGLSSVLSGLGVSASSLSSVAPIPQVQYQDLGMTLKVTPRIDRNDDVVLKIDLKIQALQGTSLNGLPVLTNRSWEAIIRLHEGASALVVGDLSRQESNAVSGTPGLSELPGFASLSANTKEFDVSNLAILVTPHVVRRRHDKLVGPVIPLTHHS